MSKRYWEIFAKKIFTIEELIKNYKSSKKMVLSSAIPVLSPLPDGTWVLVEDWNCEYDDSKYTVPQGFITDGASIPKFLWYIYGTPMDYPYSLTATLHDYLYIFLAKINKDPDCAYRKEADLAFRDYSIQLGVSKFKAYTMYCAIRLFGGSHWGEE